MESITEQFLVPISTIGLKRCFRTKDNQAYKVKNIRNENKRGKRITVYECLDTDGDITEITEDIDVYPIFKDEYDYLAIK